MLTREPDKFSQSCFCTFLWQAYFNTFLVSDKQSSKANYALGASWLAGFLRNAQAPFDWRADACT